MCRSIKPLFNFDPPATDHEITHAAEQFVRKVSGFQKPSEVNVKAFNLAISQVIEATRLLISSLETHAPPKNREIEQERAHARAIKRFGLGVHNH